MRLRLIVRLAPVAMCALPLLAFLADAAPPSRSSRRSEEGTIHIPGKTVRLAYVDAKWSKVLKDFATAAELELVADRFPSKKFHRIDASRYSLPDAQKILSSELEKLGYRLTVEGDQLVVESKSLTRKHYERPVLSDPLKKAVGVEHAEHETPEEKPRFSSSNVRPEPRAEKPARTQPPARPRKIVQPVSAEQPVVERTPAPAKKRVQPVELTTSAVRMRHQPARKVARGMYDAFKPRAELVDKGPRGLPAFTVLSGQGDDLVPRMTVSIDEENNELVIEAGADEAAAGARLLKLLDVPAVPGRTLRAVATTKDAAKVAAALQPRLDQLAQLPQRLRVAQAGQPEVPPAREGEAAPQEEQVVQPIRPGQLPDLQPGANLQGQLNLKGQVDIEALPDLGVLLLRGNKEDVDKVMAIIRQIEQLSIGTAPDVEIIFLQHVSSEGLSQLLTDVYSRLATVRTRNVQQTQTVSVIALARPNAIMVLASKADMDDVKELARKLDRPSDPENEYRVFRLKHAVASQVQTQITNLYPAATTGTTAAATGQAAAGTVPGLSPRIRVTVDVRMNAIIVQARPRDVEEIAALIADLDQTGAESVSQIRIFPLHNAVADELSNVLNDAIQAVINPPRQPQQGGQQGFGQFGGAGQTNQELRDVKSTVLQFLNVDGEGGRELRSGILADIRISPDARTNSVVVTAPEESMDLMAELVHQFDQPTSAVAEIKVFTLVNGDATTTSELLQELFTQQAQGQGQGQNQQGTLGIQLAGAEDVSSTLIPLRFSVDTRTNSIIAVGGGEALRVVEAILLRLDQSDLRQRETVVYKMRHAPATDIAEAINTFLQSQRDLQTADPGLYSPFEQLDREVIVVPELITNNLLISATPRYFKEIQEIVKKFDVKPQQVVIQALLVEVTLDNTDEFGVELGIQDSILFNRSVLEQPLTIDTTTTLPTGAQTTTQNIISQTATPGFNFNNQPLGNNVSTSPGNFASQALSSFALARVNGDLGYGGLVISGGSDSISLLLRALSARRRIDVLSRPQVTVSDNQLAQIQVGSQFPRVSGTTTNGVNGNASPTVEQVDLGIILQVIPRITPEGDVVMEIVATKSGLQPGSGVTIFTNPDGGIITSPVVDITTARTTMAVQSGQTAVMGGMITKSESHTERKVPILGDIPILGIPFRYDLHQMRRTELIIFLTPRVISNDHESETLKQIEMDRLHFIESEAEEMHGPLRSFPDALSCPPDGTDVIYDINAQPGAEGPALREGQIPGGTYVPPAMPGDTPQTTLPPGVPENLPPLDDPPQGASKRSRKKNSLSRVSWSVHDIPEAGEAAPRKRK